MKALCKTLLIAAQAAAFSRARVPSTNLPPYSLPPIPGRYAGAFDANDGTASNTSLNLSPSSAAGLLLRGGGEVVLKNFAGDAAGFFGGIRVPATFLAGSSLAAIFTMKNLACKMMYSDEEKGSMSRIEILLVRFYHVVSLSAFLLSLNTIMTATSASTAILHGRFDPMAETAYMLLKREFEYEFIACRFSFLSSMFCFLGIVVSRMLIEFDLLKGDDPKKRDLTAVIVCSVGALTAHLLSYINQNMFCWKSMIGMGVYFSKLVLERAFVQRMPLQLVSVMLALTTAFYVGKIWLSD